MFGKTRNRVQTNNTVSRKSRLTERSVPQGDCVSPAAFLLFIDMVLQELDAMKLAYPIGNQGETAVLMFADDLVIVADDPVKLQQLIDRCALLMKIIDMEANVKKCAVLHIQHKNNDEIERKF